MGCRCPIRLGPYDSTTNAVVSELAIATTAIRNVSRKGAPNDAREGLRAERSVINYSERASSDNLTKVWRVPADQVTIASSAQRSTEEIALIVDVHTHTPRHRSRPSSLPSRGETAPMRPDKPNPTAYTWEDFLAGQAGAAKSICFNIAAPPPNYRRDSFTDHFEFQPDDPRAVGGAASPAATLNDQTAEFVRAHPERLIGFLTVHPHDPGCLDEMTRATQELGLRGVKLGPNYQNFDPLGAAAFRVYRRAQELGLPVLFHQGTSPVRFADLDYAHPRHMDRVATVFPDLRVIMAHMGHPWQLDTIVVIRKHPNVYSDVSALFYRPWSQYNCLRLATEWSVLHKFLFATDYPVATVAETIAGLRQVNDPIGGTRLPAVPEDEIEKIIERDSLTLLGLT